MVQTQHSTAKTDWTTDKGLKVMVETLGTAVGKNVDFRRSDWSTTVYQGKCRKK